MAAGQGTNVRGSFDGVILWASVAVSGELSLRAPSRCAALFETHLVVLDARQNYVVYLYGVPAAVEGCTGGTFGGRTRQCACETAATPISFRIAGTQLPFA